MDKTKNNAEIIDKQPDNKEEDYLGTEEQPDSDYFAPRDAEDANVTNSPLADLQWAIAEITRLRADVERLRAEHTELKMGNESTVACYWFFSASRKGVSDA